MTQNEGVAWVSRGAADNEQVINSRGGFFFFNVLHLHSRLPQRQSAALWSANECRRLIGHWRASGGALHSLKVVFGHLDQHVRSCAISSSLTRLLLVTLCDRSLLNSGKALKLNKESSAGCNASWWNVIRKCCKLHLCREQPRGKGTEVSTDKVFMCRGKKKKSWKRQRSRMWTLHVCWILLGNQQRCAEGRLSNCTVVAWAPPPAPSPFKTVITATHSARFSCWSPHIVAYTMAGFVPRAHQHFAIIILEW